MSNQPGATITTSCCIKMHGSSAWKKRCSKACRGTVVDTETNRSFGRVAGIGHHRRFDARCRGWAFVAFRFGKKIDVLRWHRSLGALQRWARQIQSRRHYQDRQRARAASDHSGGVDLCEKSSLGKSPSAKAQKPAGGIGTSRGTKQERGCVRSIKNCMKKIQNTPSSQWRVSFGLQFGSRNRVGKTTTQNGGLKTCCLLGYIAQRSRSPWQGESSRLLCVTQHAHLVRGSS